MFMMIDITRPIHSGMAIYPGNPSVRIGTIREAKGDTSALSEISIGSHTGTHMDAMLHIASGGTGIEAYSLEQFIGDCDVIEVSSNLNVITAQDLPEPSRDRVLLKTKNSSLDIDVFDPEFIAIDESAAREIVRRGVRLIGIDGPSIKKKGVKDRVHEILLAAGIVIIEGLYLKEVKPGVYTLLCLPMRLSHVDGAPVRAILAPQRKIDY